MRCHGTAAYREALAALLAEVANAAVGDNADRTKRLGARGHQAAPDRATNCTGPCTRVSHRHG